MYARSSSPARWSADDGALLFTAADVEQLGAKSALALDRVFDVAARLSGFRESDIEELEKN